MMVEDETCRSDICMYFNVSFNVFFEIKKLHLLVSELYIYQENSSLIKIWQE